MNSQCTGTTDTCTGGTCMCGSNAACSGTTNNRCVSGSCDCGNTVGGCSGTTPMCLEPSTGAGSAPETPTSTSMTATCQVIQNMLLKAQCFIKLL